ncbi:MAG: TIGR03087 family PEP-CTERM/XrtA system glycosyltransferase [Deltaproteobacteria bacterium]|nr:TIGR03087 family PEP-CTERM/XrtA system glycosyltransferase [Deltaproteobacteria bacterium]
MNILYLAHRIPYPPNKGEKIRAFHQIRQLAKAHSVYLACLIDEEEDWQFVPTLETCCAAVDVVARQSLVTRWKTARALLSQTPLSVAAFYVDELYRKIQHRLSSVRFDCLFAFSAVMAEYVRAVPDIPKIMDFVDVDSEKWRTYANRHAFPLSWVYRLEADRLARYEEDIARTFDLSLFVTEQEKLLFQKRVADCPIAVIPNGVDLEYFLPAPRLASRPPAVIFVGAMDYFPNVDAVQYFCDEIFPLIRKVVPETRFYIVGRNPTRQVQSLGARPHVVVTGAVQDVRPYLAEAMVAVAPFRIARGIQNKVLEAMAAGLPVVGTPTVFQGMHVTPADGARKADEARSFAQEVLAFLTNPGLFQTSARAARQYVERDHQWSEQGKQLEQLLHSLVPEAMPQYAQL